MWYVGFMVGSEVVGALVGKCHTGCGAGVAKCTCTGLVGGLDCVGNGVSATVGLTPSCARQVGSAVGAQVPSFKHSQNAGPGPGSAARPSS